MYLWKNSQFPHAGLGLLSQSLDLEECICDETAISSRGSGSCCLLIQSFDPEECIYEETTSSHSLIWDLLFLSWSLDPEECNCEETANSGWLIWGFAIPHTIFGSWICQWRNSQFPQFDLGFCCSIHVPYMVWILKNLSLKKQPIPTGFSETFVISHMFFGSWRVVTGWSETMLFAHTVFGS